MEISGDQWRSVENQWRSVEISGDQDDQSNVSPCLKVSYSCDAVAILYYLLGGITT
jgi:hypothetical protein